MPSTSAKQAKFMRAVANSPKFAQKVGVPQSVGTDYEMADKKRKKFSEGGRAERMRDRRMADIEKDYQKALARGKSEKEARAKRAQREADARDDYAKRTGADRTETRAAEKAAEARLTAARRGVDKDIKPLSVTAEGSKPLATAKVDMPKVETPKVGASSGKQTFAEAFAAARKNKQKTFTWDGKPYTTEMRGEKKPATSAKAPATSAKAPATSPKNNPPATPAATTPGKGAAPAPASADAKGLFGGALLRNPGTGVKVEPTRKQRIETAVARFFAGKNRDKIKDYAKGGKAKKYAKGGKIDGIAIRGKTRLKRKK